MSETDAGPIGGSGRPFSAGDQLRIAREAKGWSLEEVASRTRIPLRSLEAIETARFDQLPSATYAVGFAKAYARQVGLDEVTIGREVRDRADEIGHVSDYVPYEIDDPTRVPSRGLAWAAGLVALLVAIGASIWFTAVHLGSRRAGASASTAPVTSPTPRAVTALVPAERAGQTVVLTATDAVWLRVYDPNNKTLFERTMQPGDRFEVPATATNPMINVGRPDQLRITIGGKAIPPLGDGSRAIKGVGVSAAALRARTQGQPAPTSEPASAAASRPTRGSNEGARVPPAFASPGSSPSTRTASPSSPASPTTGPAPGVTP